MICSTSLQAADYTVRRGPGGTDDYFFQNGAVCHKRADYEKVTGVKSALSTLFAGIGATLGLDYQTDWKSLRKLDPTYELVSAVIFDICYEYGNGKLTREEYCGNVIVIGGHVMTSSLGSAYLTSLDRLLYC